jgi:hypothetical protein
MNHISWRISHKGRIPVVYSHPDWMRLLGNRDLPMGRYTIRLLDKCTFELLHLYLSEWLTAMGEELPKGQTPWYNVLWYMYCGTMYYGELY